jgi:hypothetical protein
MTGRGPGHDRTHPVSTKSSLRFSADIPDAVLERTGRGGQADTCSKG